MREFARGYGAKIEKAKMFLKANLEKEIKILFPKLNPVNKGQYLALKEKLNDIIEDKVKGVILRSLCDDYENGENVQCTFFHLKSTALSKKLLVELNLMMDHSRTMQKSFWKNAESFLKSCTMKI